MTKFNNQELFNRMVTHLRQQGERSVDNSGDCAYRTEDGLKCAVGCLIPDDRYTPDIEGLSPKTWYVQEAAFGTADVPDETISLLIRMQGVHDSYDPLLWEQQFEAVAETFGITVPK